jgi:LacI family transcriptional regulator
VSVDNEAAAFDATRRLIGLGHRRLAFLRFVVLTVREIDPDSRERERGFRRACREAGLRPSEHAIFNTFPRDTPASASIRAVFEARPRHTAILAADASRASMAALGARAYGFTVPRDLSIACFQSREDAADGWSGPCTDFEGLGRRAVEALPAGSGPPCHLRMQCEWIDGRTTGPAPRGRPSRG